MEQMSEVIVAVKGLDAQQFAARFPQPVLVLTPEVGPLTKKQAFGQTVVGGDRRSMAHEATQQIEAYRLFRVRKRDDGIFPGMITLGRTANNDIVVPDESVSRLHAYFRQTPGDAGWEVVDARSRGGTLINGKPIEAGVSHPLRPGDRLRLGQVELLFLTPPELYKMARFLANFVR